MNYIMQMVKLHHVYGGRHQGTARPAGCGITWFTLSSSRVLGVGPPFVSGSLKVHTPAMVDISPRRHSGMAGLSAD